MPSRIRRLLLIGFVAITLIVISSNFSYSATISYKYDDLNRLIKVMYDDRTIIEYTYDEVGNRLEKVTQVDNTPPTGSIVINSGAAITTSTAVTLTLSCNDANGCFEMQFSNDGNNYSQPEPYASSKSWTLLPGDGNKSVSVKFKDTPGNWSIPYSSSIVFDITPPTTTASPAGLTSGYLQSVALNCNDGAGSGCANIYYTTDGSIPDTSSSVYSPGSPIMIRSTATLQFFAMDLAGHSEERKTEYYTIDPALCPNSRVQIDGAPYDSIQSAYNAVTVSGRTIRCRDITLIEPVTINKPIAVTLEGGYDCEFATNAGGMTILNGSLTTTATGGTLTISNFVLSVNAPPTLSSITVSPSPASVATNGTQQFTATAKDQFGNAMSPQPSFTWTVSGGGIIDGSGFFTAGGLAGGPYTVTAASGGVNGTASVTVTVIPILTSISVSPSSASVATTGTQQFTAIAKDQFGNDMSPQPSFTWTVSGGGTINSSGLFTAGGTSGGPFTVTATSGGIGGTASVIITGSPTDCPAAPASYPSDHWDRVWCDSSFTSKLADGPGETILKFDNDWGSGVVGGIASDNLGFRSGRTINFPSAGDYEFTVGSDDGVQVWIDGQMVWDRFIDRIYTTDTFTRNLTAGDHQVRLDYYEKTGPARVSFSYTPVSPPPPGDLIAHWKFDEGSGNLAQDSSGNGNNGTLVSNPVWTTGQSGGALSFDGVDDWMSVPSINGLATGNTPHTIAAWVKVTSLPPHVAWILLLGNEGTGSHYWYIDYLGLTGLGVWGGAYLSPRLTVGEWRHLAVTFDGTTLTGYLDGGLLDTRAVTFDLQGIPLTVGQQHASDNYFNGVIDDLRIYNRALTQTEVQALVSGAPSCGNAHCDEGETCSTCPDDCGVCPDIIPPTTTATPGEGTYSSAIDVALSCSDGSGSGCDKTYYSVDGSEPTIEYPPLSPVHISVSTTLRFYSRDLAGNSEDVRTRFYTITGPPSACPAVPASYPSDHWDRVWCDSSFTSKLADGPGETILKFDNDWGSGVVGGIASDNLGFRSGRTINFPSAGDYEFTVGSDDGVQVWIDGQMVWDRFIDRIYTTETFTRNLTAGDHQVRLDYYEKTGPARVSFSYTPVSPPPPGDLIAHWKFDEGSGNLAQDSSGNGNNGTLNGEPAWTSGQSGGALSFDGVDDWMSVASINGLATGNTPHTIAAWVKVTSLPPYRAWILLLGNEGTGAHHWLLDYIGLTQLGVWSGAYISPGLPVGQWRHLAVTFDGTTLTGYLDGGLLDTRAATFNLQGISLTVGKQHLSESYFNGVIDDLRIYNRALTQLEVQALFQGGQ